MSLARRATDPMWSRNQAARQDKTRPRWVPPLVSGRWSYITGTASTCWLRGLCSEGKGINAYPLRVTVRKSFSQTS